MAAFQQDTQQQYMYFENNNPYQVTGTAILPPTNSPLQQQNNSEVFTAGRKRKFPDNQQHNSTPNKQPATQPSQQLFCEVCNVQLNSLRQVADHKQGKVHQFNFSSMKDSTEQHTSNFELGPSPTPTLPKAKTIPLDGVECVVCNRMFNSKIQAEQHYNGLSHKRKLHVTMERTGEKNKAELIKAAAEESGAGTFAQEQPAETLSVETTTSEIAAPASENMESNELYCDFCCARLNSESQMSTHLKGTKHKNAVSRAALLPEYDDVKDPPLMFYCDDCNMNLNSQSQLVQHLNSAKHMSRVQRQPMDGQFRGRGRGRARGRGAFRGRQNNRGRGGAVFSTPPEITPSFV